jgi:hypothetical protein
MEITEPNTVIIKGGLGNQLFQIFALISYCIDNDYNYVFPYNMEKWDKRISNWDSLLSELKKNTCSNALLRNIPIYQENNFVYNKIPIFNNNIRLNGYFQSEMYFKDNYNHIVDLLKIREKQYELKDKINRVNSISLHFRMGDFGNIHHPILPDSYYINALKYIIHYTNKSDWNIYYACEKNDELIVNKRVNNIKNQFNNLNFIIIDHNNKDWEQLLIMSLCEHNIIANSTFSWWAAYFNNNPENIVCYPSLWFGPAKNMDLKDLFPDRWKKIDIN